MKRRCMIRRSLLTTLVGVTLCVVPNAGALEPALLEAPPSGWASYPKPKGGSPDLFCANYSRRLWNVTVSRGELVTQLQTIPRRRPAPEAQASLPGGLDMAVFQLRPQARRHIREVKQGWLIGFDDGEFGGGLWWVDASASAPQKLSGKNVLGFVGLRERILVMAGLMEQGSVLEAFRDSARQWQVRTVANLGSRPSVWAGASDDSVVIVTADGVVRLASSGDVTQVIKSDFSGLFPSSIVLMPGGTIYIGMFQFIVRVRPVGPDYAEEWFVHSSCQRFEVKDQECVCLK